MSLPTPSLPTVSFDSGNESKLYIAKASTYDESVGLSESDLLPVAGGDIQFSPSGSVESLPVYGESFDRAVKNGLSGTISFTTYAPSSDTLIADLMEAAMAVGSDSQVVFALGLPDGGFLSGAAVVGSLTPNTPVRGVASYAGELTVDGAVEFTAPTP